MTADDYQSSYGLLCLFYGIIISLIGIVVAFWTMTWENTVEINLADEVIMLVVIPYVVGGIGGIILIGIGAKLIYNGLAQANKPEIKLPKT